MIVSWRAVLVNEGKLFYGVTRFK